MLVYLHGFASSPGSHKAVVFVQALRARGVEPVVPDLNEGDFTGLTLSRQVRLVRHLTRGQEPGSVVLVGSSMGAYVAALFAAQSRLPAAAVLMAPAFDFARRWERHLGPEAMARWERDGAMDTMHFATGRMTPIGWQLMADARAQPAFPDPGVPTLVLHGRRDEVVDPAGSVAFARGKDHVELVLLGADHGLGEAVDQVLARSLSFLEPWLAPLGTDETCLTPR